MKAERYPRNVNVFNSVVHQIANGEALPSVCALLIVTGIMFGIVVVYSPAAAGIVVVGLGCMLLLAAGTRALNPAVDAMARRRVVRWTMLAFAVHVTIGSVVLSSVGLSTYLGGDALFYQTGAVSLVQHWLHGYPAPGHAVLPPGKVGFTYLLAAAFAVFGVHPEIGLVLNAALAAAVVPVMWDSCHRQFGSEAAHAVPVFLALMPGYLIWGSQLLREAGVYFLIAVAMSCASRLVRRTSVPALGILVVALGTLLTFRADVGAALGGSLAVATVFGRRRVGAGLVSGVGIIGLGVMLVIGLGLGYSGYHLVSRVNLHQVSTIRAASSAGVASGFLPGASVSDPARAVRYLPLGASYFAFGPFPWQVGSLRQVPALPDVLVWWFLLPSVWRGVTAAWRRAGREVFVEVLPALVLTVMLTLLIANFGTSVRERMQVILVLMPLIGLGWAEGRSRRRRSCVVWEQSGEESRRGHMRTGGPRRVGCPW